MPRTFAYLRVSTVGQTTENQLRDIEAAGFTVEPRRIVTETVSGSSAIEQRPAFIRLMDKLERDDVLIVTKLDRLGRNAIDVAGTVELLAGLGVRVHCLALGGMDLTSPAGRMTMGVINAVAQFERDLLIERTQSGLKRAKAEGAVLGRPTALDEGQRRAVLKGLERGHSVSELALVGATGVGKTTTIAKLAANFRLRGAVKLGLVTVDTYRVAAVEQLRTYAEIIDLPMKVVTNPLEMRRALDELAGLDLVLIDTAGRSPKDELQIQELKSLLAEAHVDEIHLVLSMTSSRQSLEAAADKFKAAGTTAMILTKLDEASGMGAVLSLARRVELPISYLTAGQAVPDDIEPAHPRRLARLVLGQERAVK
jgi:putative DNA-invertase from lambdoid prophage Rac